MGLFGKKFNADKMLAGMQAAQATLAGDYGAAAGIWGQYSDQRRKAKKADAEAAAIQQAREAAYTWAKQQGMTDEAAMTLAMDPQVAAAAVKDRTDLQQYGPEGGSSYDPVKKEWVRAPARRQVGRDIIDIDSNGKPSTIYSGIEPVVVPQGPQAGVYGWNNQGFVQPPGGGQAPPPAAGGLSDEEIEALEAQERQGGAGSQAPRNFPAAGIFGRPRFPF